MQKNWWVYLLIGFVCVVNFLPYLWMVMTGFMDGATSTATEPQWIFTPTLEAFDYLITEKGIMEELLQQPHRLHRIDLLLRDDRHVLRLCAGAI